MATCKKMLLTIYRFLLFVTKLITGRHGRYMRLFELQLFPSYWHIRRRWEFLRITWGRLHSGFRNRLRKIKVSLQIGFNITRYVFVPFGISLFLVALLVLVRSVPVPETYTPNWLQSFLRILRGTPLSSAPFDATIYVSLLSTLAQIAGVFLGLYFTAISLVLSTSYARVPASVRQLLTREKYSNFYTQVTITLLGTSLVLLGMSSVGIFPNILLAYILLAFLSALTICSFVFLGLRMFHFFDSTALVRLLLPDLQESIRAATPQGFRWQDAAFQDYYRRQASSSLDTLEKVVHASVEQLDIEGDDVARLTLNLLSILEFYAVHKGRIPTESQWLEQKWVPQDWLTTESHNLLRALQTDTPLFAKSSPDILWFEKRIIQLMVFLMDTLRERKDTYNAAKIISCVQTSVHSLAQCYAVPEALLLHRSVGAVVWPWVKSLDPEWGLDSMFEGETIVSSTNTFHRSAPLSLIDSHGLGLINLCLGLRDCVINFRVEEIKTFLTNIHWDRRESLYRTSYPREVWGELEQLQTYIAFEIKIEGHPVSPPWLQQQVMARGIIAFLKATLLELMDELEQGFAHHSQSLLEEKHFLAAAASAQRGLEACNKIIYHLGAFHECADTLHDCFREINEDVPKIDWNSLDERVQKCRKSFVGIFARLVDPLKDKPRPITSPDYFGHAFTLLVDETHRAVIEKDGMSVKEYFPTLLIGAWAAHDRVLKEYQHVPNPYYVFTHKTEPIMNVLALSGLAYIYSELEGGDIWDFVKESWDSEFNGRENAHQFSEMLASAVNDRIYKNGSWSHLRTSWKQEITKCLQDHGLLGEYYAPYDDERLQPSPHPSALIRRLAGQGSHMLMTEPEDVFLTYYLSERPEAEGIQWPREVAEMIRRKLIDNGISNDLEAQTAHSSWDIGPNDEARDTPEEQGQNLEGSQ